MRKLYCYRKLLVTSAFPYSNGSLHLGHILENIQVDIWVRYHKLIGNNIFFISSDDSHGTSIMLKSKSLKISSEKLVNIFYKEHKNDFRSYSIKHDYYGTTHSVYNQKFLLKVFYILNKKKLLFKKKIKQFYDLKESMFLQDRMITGKCPRCKSENQYGDNCNLCNHTYDAIDLIDPISILSNTIPIIKKSEHIFFNLPILTNKVLFLIKNVIKLQKPILKKSLEWFNKKLKPWNISRDSPYFGFKIPNYNKYFYVWLDATLSYISSFKKFSNTKNISYKEYWNKDSKIEFYQFIGKDIIYFHILFWPAILYSLNLRQPNKILVHGHLMVNNKKMSKSLNNYISAKIIKDNIETDYIRYYFASKISDKIKDINFNIEEFVYKINNNLINKLLNLASRSSKLINMYCNSSISNNLIKESPYYYFISFSEIIWYLYEKFDYSNVVLLTIKLSDIANKYITNEKPWIYKNNVIKIKEICSIGIYLFKIIIIYLSPIIPKISKDSEKFLKIRLNKKNLYKKFNENHKINYFNISFKKIDINKMKKFFF